MSLHLQTVFICIFSSQQIPIFWMQKAFRLYVFKWPEKNERAISWLANIKEMIQLCNSLPALLSH